MNDDTKTAAAAPDVLAIREALRELVALKDVKDRLELLHEMGHGTDYEVYHRRQPLAWAAARAALSAQGEAKPEPRAGEAVSDVLEDAAIVCERRDEFGHRHRTTARRIREIARAIADMQSRAVTGEAPSGFALVPLEAYTAVVAAAPVATPEPQEDARPAP